MPLSSRRAWGRRGMHAGDTRHYADGRRVSHIYARNTIHPCIQQPENRQHRDNQHPTCWGVTTRECTGSLFRGRQYNSVPSVAANSVAADSQSLPYPSRKPPTRGRQYMYVESTIQKAHQPWDSTREVCAFLALPSVQHARARLPKARPFMRLALDSQKPPGAFILPSRPAQPSPPPTPSVITLLPASRARRARSHTFRFSS